MRRASLAIQIFRESNDMRGIKEAFLFFLATCAIIFCYLLATGVFLFNIEEAFHSVQIRHPLPAISRGTSNFSNLNDQATKDGLV